MANLATNKNIWGNNKWLFAIISMLLLTGCGIDITGDGNSSFETSNESFEDVILNIYQVMAPAMEFITALCYMLGIWLVAVGIFYLRKAAEMRNQMYTGSELTPAFLSIVIGVLLIWWPTILGLLGNTFFGSQEETKYRQFDPDLNVNESAETILMVTMIWLARVVGLFSFVRGWLVLVKVGNNNSQPGQMSKGLTYIISGIFLYWAWDWGVVILSTFGIIQKTV